MGFKCHPHFPQLQLSLKDKTATSMQICSRWLRQTSNLERNAPPTQVTSPGHELGVMVLMFAVSDRWLTVRWEDPKIRISGLSLFLSLWIAIKSDFETTEVWLLYVELIESNNYFQLANQSIQIPEMKFDFFEVVRNALRLRRATLNPTLTQEANRIWKLTPKF